MKETHNETLGPGVVGGTTRNCEFGMLWNCFGQQQPCPVSAVNQHAADEPDRHLGPDGHFLRGSYGHRSFHVSMEEK